MLVLTRPSVRSNGRMGVPARRVMEAMGGICHLALFPDVSLEERTPAQVQLEKMAAAKARASRAELVPPKTDNSDDDICQLQMALFDIAYADPLSTDAQLGKLAAHMHERYRKVWISAADVFDPQVDERATRMARFAARIARLRRSGAAIPAELGVFVSQADVDLVGTLPRL